MLRQAAGTALEARTAWRDIARNWDTYTTGPRSTLTPVGAEIGDLVLWAGRVAHTNPAWTPARRHASPVRPGSAIADTTEMLSGVVTALHHASDALAHIAASDRESVRAAAASGDLYVPTRMLPAECDVPYRYTPAPPAMVDTLLVTYDTATQATMGAATSLDDLAFTLDLRPAVLTALRTFIQCGEPQLPPTAATPADWPVTSPAPGHVEEAVRSYGITQPALLARGQGR